jgi:hypothetical protein
MPVGPQASPALCSLPQHVWGQLRQGLWWANQGCWLALTIKIVALLANR